MRCMRATLGRRPPPRCSRQRGHVGLCTRACNNVHPTGCPRDNARATKTTDKSSEEGQCGTMRQRGKLSRSPSESTCEPARLETRTRSPTMAEERAPMMIYRHGAAGNRTGRTAHYATKRAITPSRVSALATLSADYVPTCSRQRKQNVCPHDVVMGTARSFMQICREQKQIKQE